MRKFKYLLPLWLFIVFTVCAAAQACGIVYFVLKLLNFGFLVSHNVTTEVISALTLALGFAVMLIFLNVRYTVNENNVRLLVGPLDMLNGKCYVKRIYNVVVKQEDLFFSYKCDNVPEPVIVQVNIEKQFYSDFISAIKANNPYVEVTDETTASGN